MKTHTRFALLFVVVALLPMTASAQPVLSVSTPSVTSSTTVGSDAPSQTVQVRNAGNRALKWSVVAPAGGWPQWLTVSPTSGVNSGTLTVSFKTSSFTTAQQLMSAFTVQAAAGTAGSPATVNVTVNITGSTPPPPPPLTVTCPADISVASSNGSSAVVSYSVTTSGGAGTITVTGSPASGSSFPVGTTPVTVTATSSTGQTATCGFSVIVTTTTSPLTVTCPTNMSVASPDGSPVVVTYSISTSGGVAPVTVTGLPASGSSFLVGTTQVHVTAQSTDGQSANCAFWVIVAYAPPSSTSVGPQSTITCPAGAIDILPGTNNIQAIIDAYGTGTTFCLRAGIFSVTTPITPKSNDTFIGQYGAVLDGTGGTSDNGGRYCAFQAYYPNAPSNPNIDSVTIRNLVIRNMHSCAILSFYTNSVVWTIDYNEIASNYAGIIFPSNSSIKNNYIHHNYNLGYQADAAHNSIIENNEISYNGYEQKIMQSSNVTFRGNFVHHNEGPGIWYDSNNTGALIENNRIEDNHSEGIFYEISGSATIRNNIVRRSGDTGIFISTSRDNQIYNNTLEDNFRAITFLVNCPSVGSGGGPLFFDLTNNSAHDNTIVVGTQSGAFSSALAGVNFPCTNAQLQTYQLPPNQTGSKNNAFIHNSYDVPSLNVQYWFFFDVMKFFADWRALGQDTTGTVQ